MNLIILKSILDTLGNVEVHGKDNMLRMIACMNAIEKLTQEAAQSTPDQPEEAPAETPEGATEGGGVDGK